MKIGWRYGHLKNVDQSANGILLEYEFNRFYGARVVEYLQKDGNELIDCTPPESTATMADSLNYGIKKANDNKVDYFVSFHGNCFNGEANGSEVICGSQAGIDIGNRITSNLEKLGFVNRGAKMDTRGLAEIKKTNMTANIIEPLFVDSRKDIDLLDAVGVDLFARAIAEGIVGHVINVVEPTPEPEPIPEDNSVLDAQRKLNKLKFYGANGLRLDEDGIMGANTMFAIREFQYITGLSIDGVLGETTKGAINHILNDRPMVSITINNNEVIAIRYLQWRLGIIFDGIFGNGTRNAVIGFQSRNGLYQDGIVGNDTWKVLLD
jgi:N-acetylmuramoyl-L-alanine amidase